VLISEFLNTDQLEEIENEQVEYLIVECLKKIHVVFGFNDGWNNPDEWVFDELHKQEKVVNGIKPDEFITSINKSFFEMSSSEMMTMYLQKTLFHYKKRPLFKIHGHTLVYNNYRVIPLLLAMMDLTRVYKEESPDPEVMVRVTRLIECYDKIYMMVALNCLWTLETTRNVNKTTEIKLTKFDKQKVNVIRREALNELVIISFGNNQSLSVEEIRKQIINDYNDKLEKLYNDNVIKDEDVSEDEDVCRVSKSVMVRWIGYVFDKTED